MQGTEKGRGRVSNPRADKFYNEWRDGCMESSYIDWLEDKAVELEVELAQVREAVDEVLNASVSELSHRSSRLQLAMWNLRAVRDKAALSEEGEG
jgi:hypothetical protein